MIDLNVKNGVNVIKRYINTLEAKPGIYKMIGQNNQILYIGKSKNLNKRIAQYINVTRLPYRLKIMVSLLDRIEVLFTRSEVEALILEADLIKNFKQLLIHNLFLIR